MSKAIKEAEKILKQYIEEFKETIPVGYTIKNDRNYWNWNNTTAMIISGRDRSL